MFRELAWLESFGFVKVCDRVAPMYKERGRGLSPSLTEESLALSGITFLPDHIYMYVCIYIYMREG